MAPQHQVTATEIKARRVSQAAKRKPMVKIDKKTQVFLVLEAHTMPIVGLMLS